MNVAARGFNCDNGGVLILFDRITVELSEFWGHEVPIRWGTERFKNCGISAYEEEGYGSNWEIEECNELLFERLPGGGEVSLAIKITS